MKKTLQLIINTATFTFLSLALTACFGSSEEVPITVPAGAQAGDLVGLAACTYKAGDVEYAADCGTLVVPENRNDPDSRLIALPIIRIRAKDDNPAEPHRSLSHQKSIQQTGCQQAHPSSCQSQRTEFAVTRLPSAR
jgi:hypothetical protein